MRIVNIADFRNHLIAYLAAVERGEELENQETQPAACARRPDTGAEAESDRARLRAGIAGSQGQPPRSADPARRLGHARSRIAMTVVDRAVP